MASGKTKVRAAVRRMTGWLARCRSALLVAPRLLLWATVGCAAIGLTRPASAQLSNVGSEVSVTNAITSNMTLSGTLNGNNAAGYFVTGGTAAAPTTLTINGGLLENFATSGGSGSGGGLGAGGAIFIDTNSAVILNNTSVIGNTAIGGLGGTNSPYGGTLNNIQTLISTGTSPNGANGIAGTVHPDNDIIFGDGKGNGVAGFGVTNGGNATNGFGGIGGAGAAGTDGWNADPLAEIQLDIAIAKVAADTGKLTVDTINLAAYLSQAISDWGAAGNPFSDPLALVSGSFSIGKTVLAGVSEANDTTALGADVQTEIDNQNIVNNWENLAAAGLAGNGGPGEAGGSGGKGSYGFGGGAGGQGGAYGLTSVGPLVLFGVTLAPGATVDGTGGAGGAGGAGGFGGGGGAGGYGFGAGQNGCGLDTSIVSSGCTSSSGAGGAGGAAGFGGGVGSKGGVTGVSNATGGGGGDAYGGAIFVNTGGVLTITGNATFSGNTAIGGASLNGGLAGGAAGSDLFMMQGSTVNLAPGGGNIITFNGTIADNSTTSIGAPTVPQTAGYPTSGGASLTVYAGTTVFNGANTYSGQTVINGGQCAVTAAGTCGAQTLNPGSNTSGAPNYALTDGALQAMDGVGLPTASNLNFGGPGQFTGGVLQVPGVVLSGGVVSATTFTRQVSANPNPFGGGTPDTVQWTGSGGFAAINDPLVVTLNAGAQLTWGANGFVPTGYSLMFGSAQSNATVTFTNGIDISGGSYAAGTAASILVGNNGNVAGSTAIISGVISNNTSSGDLSIGGGGFNGTLILTAANTYTGATVINSGTLEISGNGSIADSSGVIINGPGTFIVANSSAPTVINTLSGSGTVALNGSELQINQTSTFNGVLADGSSPGSLIVNGAGTVVTLTGTNSYSGDTTIMSGATLALIGTGSISASTPVIDNGNFDISQTASGAAITTLTGSKTGVVSLGSGMLMIAAGAAGTTGVGTNGVFAGVIADGGIACTAPPAGANCAGGMLVISGGNQTLSGVNTYTGATIVSGGATLALQTSGSIATSIGLLDNGTFDISLTSAGASLTTLAGAGLVSLGNQKLTIINAANIFTGVIADGGFNNAKGGQLEISSGTETLTGINTYTGTTTTDLGAALALAGTGSIALSSEVLDNGTFDISQTALGAVITTLSGSGRVALGSDMLLVTNGGAGAHGNLAPGVFSGVIADAGIACTAPPAGANCTGGTLAVGGGTQALSGHNTYTGGTLISSGATLALIGSGSIATSAGVFDNGTFDISQTTAGASIATLLGTGLVSLGNQQLTITAGSTIFAGVIADGGFAGGTGGSLTVNGGLETLSGTNTYTGDTTINSGGILALTGVGSIAQSDVVQLATNGFFDISQTTAGASIMTLADTAPGQAGNVLLGGQTLTITSGSTTFSGVVADGGLVGGSSGNLTISGGIQTLAGVNTYTGLTTINSGATLALTGNGSISQSGGVVANGTFDISAVISASGSIPPALGTSITTLSGSGNVTLGGNYLTITAGAAGPSGTDAAGIFSGVVSGAGGIVVTGAGSHEELTGVNKYAGGTSLINGGTLSINNSNSLGANTSALTINNGTLVVDASITVPQPISFGSTGPNVLNLNSFNLTLAGALSGPGGFAALNGGILSLTGTTSGLGSIVLGTGTTLITSSSASAGLASTPIVVLSPSGAPLDVFTGSAHVVGPLDIVDGTIPELIILPGDELAGNGGVSIKVVIQGGGTTAPGDAPGAITVSAPVVDLANSTYSVQIDGPLSSAANCAPAANPNGCANNYATVIVTGGNSYTAAGVLAPTMIGWGAPGPLPSNYIPPVTTSFIIVQAEGGVLGNFSGLVQPALGVPGFSGGLAAGTRLDTLYYNTGSATAIAASAASAPGGRSVSQYSSNPNAIALWVTPADYTNLSPFGVTLTQNQRQLASALNTLRGPAGAPMTPQATWDFGYLFGVQPQNLPSIMDSLTGEVDADAAQGALKLADQFLQLMLDPFTRPAGGNGSGASAVGFADEEPQLGMPVGVASAYDAEKPAPATFNQRWTAWGAGFGSFTSTKGDAVAGTHDLTTSTYGFAAGMDYTDIPGALFGFALSGGGDQWQITQQNLGKGTDFNFQAGIYGKAYYGDAYLGAAVTVANNWMKTNRSVTLGSDQLSASFSGQTYGVRAEAGYDVAYNDMKITPFAAGQALAFRSPNYSEYDSTGGGFALSYSAKTETDVSTQLGARFAGVASVGEMPLIWRMRAAWEHDWVNSAGLAATFQAGLPAGVGASFIVTGVSQPQNLAVASAGADLYVTKTTSISSKFEAAIAQGSQTYGGSLTLRQQW